MAPTHIHVDSNDTLSEEKHSARELINVLTDGFNGDLSTWIASSGVNRDKLEPLAIIGFSLKFPQDATSAESFWRMLVEGRSALSDIPKERFNIDAFFHPSADRIGSINARGGHFIKEDLAAFDAPFFSLTPTEAACMDPQQRLLLEIAYRALENAGIPMEKVTGSNTSVHIGCFLSEYSLMLSKDTEKVARYQSTGTGFAMLANRLSWFYDLTGPSIAIDTACSSSLNALHLACQSLRSGESTMGLVGGCNLFYSPEVMVSMTDLGFLSPDSKCHSFDERANGYSRGEGLGLLVIKRLSDAIRDGNMIRAVIRATRSNQDGRTPGITQPSREAQEALIRETYLAGGLDMATTRFFEAHGTGTSIGDAIEGNSIGNAFKNHQSRDKPLFVGAVKSNIGHLGGASGVARLIKAILVLEKGVIPPNIWFERPNPKLKLDDWNIKFPLQNTPWPTDGLRRASVNSFGFGGSNVHVVLDDAYNYLQLRSLHGKHCTSKLPPTLESLASERHYKLENRNNHKAWPQLLVWSASDEAGLKRLTTVYCDHLLHLTSLQVEDSDNYLSNLAYTLSVKRSLLPWKSFTIATSIRDLQCNLEKGLPKPIRSSRVPRLGFIFTGQGAQWHAMGRELFVYPLFAQNLRDAELFFHNMGCEWGLIDELHKEKNLSNLNKPAFGQPVCTALQIAIVDLFESWGILPSTVIGHSSGEIAAAYCAGALSRESAWKIAYHRGVLVERLKNLEREPETMMAVNLSEANVQPYLRNTELGCGYGNIAVGCINSPHNVTITGSEARIDSLKLLLEQEEVFVRKLKVDVAYHSQSMNQIASEYRFLIKDVLCRNFSQRAPAMFSSLTGHRIDKDELSKGEYWVKNLICPVRFLDAMNNLYSKDYKNQLGALKGDDWVDHLIEIGPHAALQGPIRDILNASAHCKDVGYSSVLRRGLSAQKTSLSLIGHLHCLGYPVDLAKINNSSGLSIDPAMLTDLPEYPFNHSQKYWLESRFSKDYRFRKSPKHELLGTPTTDWNPLAPRWRNIIRSSENSWIDDHKVNGVGLYPAAGMLVMAIEAARQLADSSKKIIGYRIKDVTFRKALMVSSSLDGIETEICLRPLHNVESQRCSWSEFHLYTYENEQWSENCQGAVAVEYDLEHVELDNDPLSEDYARLYRNGVINCKSAIGSAILYNDLGKMGLYYGPCFQILREIFFGDDGEATALVNLRHWRTVTSEWDTQPHVIHPTALDGLLQLMFPAHFKGRIATTSTMVPTRIRNLWVSRTCEITNGMVKAYAKINAQRSNAAESSIVALNTTDDEPCVIVEGLETTSVASNNMPSPSQLGWRRLCYDIDWKPDLDLLNNGQITAYCGAAISDPVAADLTLEKELVCFLAISNAVGKPMQTELMKAKPYLRRYIDWMNRQMEKYANTWNFGHLIARDSLSDTKYRDELHDKVGTNDAEGRLLVEIARNLLNVLGGEIDALTFLFKDDLIEKYYHEDQSTVCISRKLDRYVDALAHKSPNMKILEIGGGTGSTTKSILRTLMHHGEKEPGAPRFSQYSFTDISPSFFEKARELFGVYSDRATFTTLNIENDPLEQGREAGEYDLIIAANVFHATASLTSTLRNARKLLKPGGKLILQELVNPEIMRNGFIFGLLPGWWLSDEEPRRWSPLLREKDWHRILSENHFSGVDTILSDFDDEKYHTSSAMISTASQDETLLTIPGTVVIVTKGSWLQNTIAQQLRSRLQVLGSPKCDIIFSEDISSLDLHQKMCVFLVELEKPFLFGISSNSYLGLQRLLSSSQGLLWVSNGEDISTSGMIAGLSRSIRSENENFIFITLSLQDVRAVCQIVDHISNVFKTALALPPDQMETEFQEENGVLRIPRVVEANYLNQHIYSNSCLSKNTADYYFDENSSYVISGGFGGLGRSMASWMVSRRAKHLILLSRLGAHTETAAVLLDELKSKGVTVASPLCDVSDEQSLATVLMECRKTMPPIKGCIQSALVLKDGLFDGMSFEDFEAVTRPKVQGSWNLHALLPQNMDFFVLLASISGIMGTRGQANYASASTYQDALARYRNTHGEKAISIDLGVVLSIGYVAERPEVMGATKSQGWEGIHEPELHAMLDYYCNPALPVLPQLKSQLATGIETPASLHLRGGSRKNYWIHRPMFRHLHQINAAVLSPSAHKAETRINSEALFLTAKSLSQIEDIICQALVTKLSNALTISKDDIDTRKPMHVYGVDSLVAVDIRNWFNKEMGALVTIFEILGSGSIYSLALMVASKSRYVRASLKHNTDS